MAHCTLSHAWAVSVTNHTIMCESSPQTASVILYLSQTQGQNASNAGVSPSTTAPPPRYVYSHNAVHSPTWV